jgi:histone H3/H4
LVVVHRISIFSSLLFIIYFLAGQLQSSHAYQRIHQAQRRLNKPLPRSACKNLKEATNKMSMKISKAEFLANHAGRRTIDYAKVKEWILAQGDNAITVQAVEQKFNLRFSTLSWRAKQEGDKITSGTIEREGKKTKMFVLEVGVSQPVQRKRKTTNTVVKGEGLPKQLKQK